MRLDFLKPSGFGGVFNSGQYAKTIQSKTLMSWATGLYSLMLLFHILYLNKFSMANKNLSADKERQGYLHVKLQQLTQQKEKLEKELEAGFDMDTNRKLALVENSIACTVKRLEGKFTDPAADLTVQRIQER